MLPEVNCTLTMSWGKTVGSSFQESDRGPRVEESLIDLMLDRFRRSEMVLVEDVGEEDDVFNEGAEECADERTLL